MLVGIHCNGAVNVFPEPPHSGAAWGLPRGLTGGLLFAQAPGVWGFSQALPQIGITGFVYIENLSDYSSDCYKIKVLFYKTLKLSCSSSVGVDVRQSYMFKVMGGGAGGISHVQDDGRECRGASHVQGDGMGVSHVQGDCREVRGVINVEGDGRGEER